MATVQIIHLFLELFSFHIRQLLIKLRKGQWFRIITTFIHLYFFFLCLLFICINIRSTVFTNVHSSITVWVMAILVMNRNPMDTVTTVAMVNIMINISMGNRYLLGLCGAARMWVCFPCWFIIGWFRIGHMGTNTDAIDAGSRPHVTADLSILEALE